MDIIVLQCPVKFNIQTASVQVLDVKFHAICTTMIRNNANDAIVWKKIPIKIFSNIGARVCRCYNVKLQS